MRAIFIICSFSERRVSAEFSEHSKEGEILEPCDSGDSSMSMRELLTCAMLRACIFVGNCGMDGVWRSPKCRGGPVTPSATGNWRRPWCTSR